jgi:cell division protein ZipA
MEESFRNTLIIISAIIIGAIFVHGLWSIRKHKNPYKLKAKPQNLDELPSEDKVANTNGFSGFDQDGIGQIKVVNKAESLQLSDDLAAQQEQPTKAAPSSGIPSEPLPCDIAQLDSMINDDFSPELTLDSADDIISDNALANTLTTKKIAPKAEVISVYNDPVSQPKPQSRKKVGKKLSKAELKRNQIEINFGNTDAITTEESSHTESMLTKTQIEPEVLAISVIAPQGQIISGAALLPTLLTLGMKYGEMNIFHRHQDNAGNGKVTFSLANALNPGTFDLDNMESFVTQGVSLFMTLPNAGNAFEVFDQMLIAAKQLASEFNAQLLDDKRSVLTKQTEQHYISRIREFERKSRIAAL